MTCHERRLGSLLDGDRRFHRYELHAFTVMPNHLHVLVTPRVVSTKWLGPLKGFAAHEANRILGRSGKQFWQDESYDHVVRFDAELDRIRCYIENNPEKAGIVDSPEDFPWSSAKPPERRLQPGLAASIGCPTIVLLVLCGAGFQPAACFQQAQ